MIYIFDNFFILEDMFKVPEFVQKEPLGPENPLKPHFLLI